MFGRGAMEGVAGLMKGLKLSEEERKGVRIRISGKEKGKSTEAQAVGKVMSEKLAHPDAICLSLGKVWCPIKGIRCKEVGENRFVFTFLHESGKRKAIDDGPWMFDKDLVVVEDFDPSKRIENYAFNNIPIWVRVFDLPLGMMNGESAEEIGNNIGQFVEADTAMDGNAIGRFMRIKIRMRIDKPLMRGFTLEEEEEEGGQQKKKKGKGAEDEDEDGEWCRFEYEYLPNVCYTCGIIGHGEKDCAIKLKKGEKQQFGKWLKAEFGQRRGSEEGGLWRRSERGFEGNRNYGFSRSFGRTGSGSGSLSWRKSGLNGKLEGGEEVTSPAKIKENLERTGIPKRLDLNTVVGKTNVVQQESITGEGVVVTGRGEHNMVIDKTE